MKKLSAKWFWLSVYTAAFVVMAAFVFWGTWSMDFVPVMPDSPIVYPPDWFAAWWRGWIGCGKFIPNDIRVFFGHPHFWQELNYAIPMYVSGLALAYYLRGKEISRVASFGAGLFLAFSGYWCTLFSAGHGSWFHCMTYVLFPFGLADRAVRKGKLKNWLLLGATVGWASSWQTDLWLLFTELIGCYFIFCCVVARKFPWKGMLISGVAVFIIGGANFRSALVSDLASRDEQIKEGQTVATADKAAKMDEDDKRWIFTTNWSLPPSEIAEFFIPRLNGDTSCPLTLSIGARYGTGVRQYTGALGRPKDAPSGNYRQHSLYVGFITCLLALLGVVAAFFVRRDNKGENGPAVDYRKDIIFFAVAALVCCLLSLGRFCEPVYRIFYAMPFGNYLRAPVKWHHLTEFCICVLAGFGIEFLLSQVRKIGSVSKWAPWIVGAIVLIGAADLARIDHLYCAPVDLTEARKQNCSFQMSFLRRTDFSNPQVAAMVKAKRIIALAQPNPEMYLVGILTPWGKPAETPLPPFGTAAWLGILSILGTIGLAAYGICLSLKPKKRLGDV